MTNLEQTDKCVFLDRDGVLIEDVSYPGKRKDIIIMPGVKEAVHILKSAGYKLIVITNQSGIARGYFTEEDCKDCNKYMEEQLELTFDAIYYCPHHPEDGCECRKPKPGMIEQALKDFPSIDPAQSFMVGNNYTDIACGKAAGCQTVRVADENYPDEVKADIYVDNLLAFAQQLTTT